MKTNLIYQNQFSDAECDWIINESERVLDVKKKSNRIYSLQYS